VKLRNYAVLSAQLHKSRGAFQATPCESNEPMCFVGSSYRDERCSGSIMT
jgi:hypothetical protein